MEWAEKPNIRTLTAEQITDWVKSAKIENYRAKQIYDWLWVKQVASFEAMSNLSKALRQRLEEQFTFPAIRPDLIQQSMDGTIKTRFLLTDGEKIESVLIPVPEDKRFTVCVSTQVGCSLSCAFCATGKMKRTRNLEAFEIVDQYIQVNQQSLAHYAHPLTNIVYMGMGEPLLNYAEVMESIRLLTQRIGLSPRRITISTAGIAKMIQRLADEEVKFNLALSLHAADDQKRHEIMPINEHNHLRALMDALDYFYQKTRNKITFEYIAFDQFNDTLEDARNLLRLCRRFPVTVNIIEYNRIEGFDGLKSSDDKINQFARFLREHQVDVTVRKSRGKDIDAACGQLANKN